MAVTAKDLAQILHLSEAAVSMALNGKPGVSTATRRKVMDTAKELGYDFSRIADKAPQPQPPRGTLYFIIYRKHGAVVADTPFFSHLSQGIGLGCKNHRYYLNVFYLDEGDNPERQLRELIHFDCKGILLLGTEMLENDLIPFLKLQLPLVILDTYFETTEADYVLINNAQGAYLATSHLISRCREQPGYLRSSYPINNFTQRADGFYRAVRTNGMSTANSKVHYLSPSPEGAYADMLMLLNGGETPARCYFADNDLIAWGAMKALKEKGYRIPEDVALAGFDNMPMSACTEPALTTVNVPKEYMGEMAVTRLSQLIEANGGTPVKLEVSTTLVKRETV